MANTQNRGELVIDNRLEAYESFFDTTWAKRLHDLTDRTNLAQPAFDLCTDWKGAGNTFRLPWVIMMSLDSFQKGFTQTHEPFWRKLTQAFSDYLLRADGVTLSNTQREELSGIIEKLSQRIREAVKQTPAPFQIEHVWGEYIKNPEFVLSIWSSQRLCYSAIYYGYENFLRRCIAVAKPAHEYRPKTKRLQSDLNDLIGSGMGDLCLADASIEVARLVRHSLAHNGGRLTPEIANKSHGLTVHDGMIHIMPDDTRGIHDLLKTRVIMLVERAVTLPQFGT